MRDTAVHGDHARAIRPCRTLFAQATGQRQHDQSAGRQCHAVCGRTWLQMARASQAVRQLAHDLHAHAALGQDGRAGQDVRGTAARAGGAHQDQGGLAGQHQHQGASRWHWRSKKNGPQAIGKSRGGWNTKIHMVAADARTAVTFCLSPGQAHDAPEGRRLLESLGTTSRPIHLLMDRAYEGNETRQLALDLGFIPVVPPLKTRIEPWQYDREMYKRRNEVERLFRRLKGFRRIFSRFEKLDVMFLGFLSFVLVADGLRGLCYR
jgi:transposase